MLAQTERSHTMSDSLLIIEDETLLGNELARHFQREQWEVTLATTLEDARHWLFDSQLDPLVVLSDMSLPDGSGLDLLADAREAGNRAEWVLLTGYGSVPDSVRALHLGAHEFLEKPCDRDRLDLVISGAARSARAQRRLNQQQMEGSARFKPSAMYGNSEANRRVRALLERLARVPFSSLLILGETGTGKGLAARILHHVGARADGPMVQLNCAALPRELLESELFGHEAGAFTGARGRHRGLFEQASGGTLFLDEIGELDIDLQAKLLTAIEERRIRRLGGDREIGIDVQVIAASHRNLAERVADGLFRADLYHRLSVFQIELPPLRERLQDLDELVPAFVAEFNAKAGRQVRKIPPAIMARLKAHDWPGNVRELRNAIERSVLLSEHDTLSAQWLQLGRPQETEPQPHADTAAPCICLPLDGTLALEDIDRRVIQAALEQHDYNVSATARALRTTRETLRYRMQKYQLQRQSG
ncbi:sigma-54-dependent transcriptional regulator [Acidihalobacter prosperus]|uniref:Sigma-54-dependent Fis family transcriptional regulator n=1 Tax=Acidihalobacter prosperus TaxID=160660 RepID=A0A1A6C8R6_9GAMM|nr:sigma-54 dependent transcriptional regulator [Acidihalobacter prosperus]OBS10939.1 sigma-54-dependent Fis family transcriptional regulator [Acidihalobacter prosperus]